MNHESIINSVVNDIISIKLISETNNKVYKITTKTENLYAKFYEENSSHIDNELKIYELVDNKYLKRIYYKSLNPKMAIFYELVGKTVDELTEKELKNNCTKIICSICDYFDNISKNKVKGFGILDENLNGKYNDFHEFLKTRQQETALILSEYKELNNLFNLIFKKYKKILYSDNSLVPIDTNLKNVMVLNDGTIKFNDPGEMISGPIMMAYGDFVAHTYNTILYEELLKKLKLDEEQEKLLRIYAIFSSLNILAFLRKNGVKELDKVIPYGNTKTFYNLINEHLKYLNLI